MAATSIGGLTALDMEEMDDLVGRPPAAPVSPFYSVSRQRARQRIRSARSCQDVGLRAQRLAAALEVGELAGLPEESLAPLHEELTSVEQLHQALQDDMPSAPEAVLRFDAQRRLRPVTPVKLLGPLSQTMTPGVVAILTLSDDGWAELRDAAEPWESPKWRTRVISEGTIRPGSVFSALRRDMASSRDSFDYAALQDMLDEVDPHRAVVALVDPLRPGGQILCSRVLSRGPQGLIRGVVAAVPSVDTPPPFAGPSYGALSALVCLGAESLGLGGIAWANGGVFGRALGFADRAAAYAGGWPSAGMGRLAYKVAVAADLARGPGGNAGTFLFGHPKDSPSELARASSVLSWLRGSTQATATARAWAAHFVTIGIPEAVHNEGPMWLGTAEKAGRWPGREAPPKKEEGEDDEGDGDADLDADAGDGDDGDADGKPAAAPPPPEEPPEDCAGGPPEVAQLQITKPPPVADITPAKFAVPFGDRAKNIVDSASTPPASGMFKACEQEALPDGVWENFAEVLIVADLADPRVLTWPREHWQAWASWCRGSGSTLACAAILPGPDDADVEWHSIVFAVKVLVEDFNLAVWLGDKATPDATLKVALTALLDSSVSLVCLAAHLSPFESEHFAVAYCASTAAGVAEDSLDARRCVAVLPTIPREAAGAGAEALSARLDKANIPGDEAVAAASGIHSWLYEFIGHCGLEHNDAEAASAKLPAGDGEADGGDADEDPPAEADDAAGGDEGDGGDDTAAPARPATAPAADVGKANLLSFVMGGVNAANDLESALTITGSPVLDSPVDGPSLAYPACAYGYGSVPPKPWGTQWAHKREDAVVFAVHTRAIYAILARIIGGVDVGGAEEPVMEETNVTEEDGTDDVETDGLGEYSQTLAEKLAKGQDTVQQRVQSFLEGEKTEDSTSMEINEVLGADKIVLEISMERTENGFQVKHKARHCVLTSNEDPVVLSWKQQSPLRGQHAAVHFRLKEEAAKASKVSAT